MLENTTPLKIQHDPGVFATKWGHPTIGPKREENKSSAELQWILD